MLLNLFHTSWLELNGFPEWATVAGGFAGFLSFAFVLYEKISRGPKISCEILSANADEQLKDSNNFIDYYGYPVFIKAEVGNIGNELTTITSVELHAIEKKQKSISMTRRVHGLVDSQESYVFEPGLAGIYDFTFYFKFENKIENNEFNATLILKLLDGSKIKRDTSIIIKRK